MSSPIEPDTEAQIKYFTDNYKSDDPARLLAEWYLFWATNDEVPSKMPDSLHTRTLVYLVSKMYEDMK